MVTLGASPTVAGVLVRSVCHGTPKFSHYSSTPEGSDILKSCKKNLQFFLFDSLLLIQVTSVTQHLEKEIGNKSVSDIIKLVQERDFIMEELLELHSER